MSTRSPTGTGCFWGWMYVCGGCQFPLFSFVVLIYVILFLQFIIVWIFVVATCLYFQYFMLSFIIFWVCFAAIYICWHFYCNLLYFVYLLLLLLLDVNYIMLSLYFIVSTCCHHFIRCLVFWLLFSNMYDTFCVPLLCF